MQVMPGRAVYIAVILSFVFERCPLSSNGTQPSFTACPEVSLFSGDCTTTSLSVKQAADKK